MKVYYATNPKNDNYRWYTRGPRDFYIMAHKNALSKSTLDSHSFYDDMEFTEITVPETVAWVNYILDRNEYVDITYFNQKIWNTLQYKQSIGRGIRKNSKPVEVKEMIHEYKRGDIVIAKNKLSSDPWLLELGNPTAESDGEKRWNLVLGFKMSEAGKVVQRFGTAYANQSDLIRPATGEEKEYFVYCKREGKVLVSSTVSPNSVEKENNKVLGVKTQSNDMNHVGNIITFGSKKNKKVKVNKSKVKFKINKIQNYEY